MTDPAITDAVLCCDSCPFTLSVGMTVHNNQKTLRLAGLLMAVGLMEGCGGGGGGSSSAPPPPPATYAVGGTVSGLSGIGLMLQNNAGNDLTITANGSFSFATKVTSGTAYVASVAAQPSGPDQNCTISNGTGSGTVGNGAVTTIALVCRNVGRFAYVTNYTSNDLSALAINTITGELTALPGSPYATGISPTYVKIDRSSHFVYVPNYDSNSISAFVINTNTGALITATGSPFATGLTPGNIVFNPTSQFMYVSTRSPNPIFAYRSDVTTGVLTPVPGSPFANADLSGSGFMAVEPSGKFAYVGSAVANSISGYAIDQSTGALTPVVGSPFGSVSPGAIGIDPMGKVLLASHSFNDISTPSGVSAFRIDQNTGTLSGVAGNPFASGGNPGFFSFNQSGSVAYVTNSGRWNNGVGDPATSSLSSFAIDPSTGVLTSVSGSAAVTGTFPQEVAIDPSGTFAYVANTLSNNISAYRIDAATGALTQLPGSPIATGGGPNPVRLDPSGKFAFVANAVTNDLSVFSISASTGALTPVPGSPFPVGTGPIEMVISQ